MEHYVIVNNWARGTTHKVDILGVTHSMEEAKEVFHKHIADEKERARRKDYYIYTDAETKFDAGIFGAYSSNHICLYIETV